MFPNVGPLEMMMLLGIAVLLFGKRLPEVGRSLGKGIIEFKKGLSGAVDELDISRHGPIFVEPGSSSARTPAAGTRGIDLHGPIRPQVRAAGNTVISRWAAGDGVSGCPARLNMDAGPCRRS